MAFVTGCAQALMPNPDSINAVEATSQRKWAVVRLILGQAQVIGATITLVLLIQTGSSVLTLRAAIVTALLTLASVLLFKSGRKAS